MANAAAKFSAVVKTTSESGIVKTMTVELPDTVVHNLLCCALEGGVGYWNQITGYEGKCGEFPHLDTPMSSTGALLTRDTEEDVNLPPLTRGRLQEGLQIMATKYPRHFENLLEENEDAETGDVFLQCCLLGEVVYG